VSFRTFIVSSTSRTSAVHYPSFSSAFVWMVDRTFPMLSSCMNRSYEDKALDGFPNKMRERETRIVGAHRSCCLPLKH
jgi:hypothetical protein